MNKSIKNRLIFYWISSFIIAYIGYYILWLVMPNHYVFGVSYRMMLYHWEFPLQYIAIVCFFYGIIASIFSEKFKNQKTLGRILICLIIIILSILFSSPFGGMLWFLHDMNAGFFPQNWFSKILYTGSLWGLQMGWYIILLSIPYNVFGSIICYFLTKKGVEIY